MPRAQRVIDAKTRRCPRCKTVKLATAFPPTAHICKRCIVLVAMLANWRREKSRGDIPRPYRVVQQDFDNEVGRWNVLDDVRFIALVVLGVPKSHAARLLGRTAGAGSLRLQHIRNSYSFGADVCGAQHPEYVWHGERLEALRRLLQEGLSRGEAAKRLGVSRSAVLGAAYRHLPDLCKTKAQPCQSQKSLTVSPADRA